MPVQIPLYGGVTPQRTQSPDEFANNGDDWLEYQAPLPATYNALATEVNDNAIVAEGAKDDAVSARNITLDAKNVVVNAQSDVTAKAGQVTIDTQTVSDNTQMVVDAQSDVTAKAGQVTIDSNKVAEDKESVDETAQEVATAQAVIGTSIDGVYANAAAIVSINDTILRLHPII